MNIKGKVLASVLAIGVATTGGFIAGSYSSEDAEAKSIYPFNDYKPEDAKYNDILEEYVQSGRTLTYATMYYDHKDTQAQIQATGDNSILAFRELVREDVVQGRTIYINSVDIPEMVDGKEYLIIQDYSKNKNESLVDVIVDPFQPELSINYDNVKFIGMNNGMFNFESLDGSKQYSFYSNVYYSASQWQTPKIGKIIS